MKRLVTMCALCSILASCIAPKGIETHIESQNYGNSCENPSYIATIAKEGNSPLKDSDGMYGTSSDIKLTLANLVKEAQKRFGDDVTIANVRWDLENGKRKSVVYDVIKCK